MLLVKFLERCRAEVAEGGVFSLSIVEELDVGEHMLDRLGTRQVVFVVDPFGLELAKKTLGRRVVVAVATPAHATQDLPAVEQALEIIAGILAAAVAVMQQPGLLLAIRQGHLQGIEHDRRCSSVSMR